MLIVEENIWNKYVDTSKAVCERFKGKPGSVSELQYSEHVSSLEDLECNGKQFYKLGLTFRKDITLPLYILCEENLCEFRMITR
jgi:hypothetical protein